MYDRSIYFIIEKHVLFMYD